MLKPVLLIIFDFPMAFYTRIYRFQKSSNWELFCYGPIYVQKDGLPQSLSYYLPVRKSVSYVLAWEIENHFLSDAPGDRNDQLTEKEDLPSEITARMTFQAFEIEAYFYYQ